MLPGYFIERVNTMTGEVDVVGMVSDKTMANYVIEDDKASLDIDTQQQFEYRIQLAGDLSTLS
jgi:hypothetical protein